MARPPTGSPSWPIWADASAIHAAAYVAPTARVDVRTEEELRRALDRILGEDGPLLVCVKVVKGRAEGGFDRDVVGYSRRFMQALAALPAR